MSQMLRYSYSKFNIAHNRNDPRQIYPPQPSADAETRGTPFTDPEGGVSAVCNLSRVVTAIREWMERNADNTG